jgi:hypothetical protein
MRERDKKILQSAKLIMAFCAGVFAVVVWGLNVHDKDISLAAFHGAVDVVLFCLGAHGTVAIADSVEAIMTRNKSVMTGNYIPDPKDVDDGSVD